MSFYKFINPTFFAKRIASAHRSIAKHQRTISSKEREISVLQAESQKCLEEIDDMREKIKVATSELEELEKKVEECSDKREKFELENKINYLSNSIPIMDQKIAGNLKKIERNNESKCSLEESIEFYESLKEPDEKCIAQRLRDQEKLKIYEESYNNIQNLSETNEELLEKLKNVNYNPIGLPFLDDPIHAPLEFKLIDGRVRFSPRQKLHDLVNVLETDLCFDNRRGFMLYGVKGAGKSHILHAVACYYIKRNDHVVYFSNAYRACNPMNWISKLKNLIYLESLRPNPDMGFIIGLDNALDKLSKISITEFFLLIGNNGAGQRLKIFIDHVDSLPDSNIQPKNTFLEKTLSKQQLEYYLAQSKAVFILCATANSVNSYPYYGNGIVYIPMLSGFNSVEYDKWFGRSIKSLRAEGKSKCIVDMFIESKDRIEFITGANPLYLNKYLMAIKPTYEETLKNLLNDREINTLKQEMADFCTEISEIVVKEEDKKALKRYILRCVRNEPIYDSDALPFVFLRYFYVLGEWKDNERLNNREGCWSSALAAHYLSKIMSLDKDINWTLEGEYERQEKLKKELAKALEKHGINQIKDKGISACELTNGGVFKIYDECYMAQIELVDNGPSVLYFKPILQVPEVMDGLILTNDKIIGIKYTISPNPENPYQTFARSLKQIPFFKTNKQKYRICFCWMITSNCTGSIFNSCEMTFEDVTIDVRAERFGQEVEEMRQQANKKNEREIAMCVANMTLTLKPGPKRKNLFDDDVGAHKRARQ